MRAASAPPKLCPVTMIFAAAGLKTESTASILGHTISAALVKPCAVLVDPRWTSKSEIQLARTRGSVSGESNEGRAAPACNKKMRTREGQDGGCLFNDEPALIKR